MFATNHLLKKSGQAVRGAVTAYYAALKKKSAGTCNGHQQRRLRVLSLLGVSAAGTTRGSRSTGPSSCGRRAVAAFNGTCATTAPSLPSASSWAASFGRGSSGSASAARIGTPFLGGRGRAAAAAAAAAEAAAARQVGGYRRHGHRYNHRLAARCAGTCSSSNHHLLPALGCSSSSSCCYSTKSATFSDIGIQNSRAVAGTGRCFSSRGRKDGRGGNEDQLYALPFTVSPQDALSRFAKWADDEQGLHYLLQRNSIRITAAYCPVWSFDVNVRFVVRYENESQGGKRKFGWKPEIFRDAYGSQPVVHLPGLAAYAGYSFRRSLVNPLHNTTLVFLGDDVVPFGNWMLRPMELGGQRLEIFPDPWNTTRGRAFAVVKEELQSIASQELSPEDGEVDVDVQTEILSSRRVQMPTYAIDYKVMGIEYRAFVSGCDASAGVSGDSHKVIDASATQEAYETGSNFLSSAARAAQAGARVLGGRGIFVVLQLLGGVVWRVLARLPVVGLFAGVFVGFRKVVQPFLAKRKDTAEWERQREHESIMEDRVKYGDDFVDSGSAQRYFRSNRGRILRYLSGEYEHEQGTYDWYQQWEEWARRQWEQQKQQQGFYQQQQQQTYQQQQQRQQRPRQKPKPDFQWDFDPNDPYSVLGIKRGATKAEVAAAYRKEIMKHHPDRQGTATEAEKLRASERAKLINDAYRTIKQQMK